MNILKGTVVSTGKPRAEQDGAIRLLVTLESEGRQKNLLIAWSDGCRGFDNLKRGLYLEVHVEPGHPRDVVRYARIAEREINLAGQTVTVEQDSLF